MPILTGILGIFTIPALMVLAEWRFARQNIEREVMVMNDLETGRNTKEIKTSLSLSDEKKYAVAFVTISL